jgi:hypothetical protein
MATAWFYTIKGQKQGPVGSQQLKELAQQSILSPSDMVWKEGMQEWASASKIKGLFPEGSDAAPPPPPVFTNAAVPVVVKMESPIQISKPREGVLAKLAKWATIGWSALCLFFVFSGLANVSAPTDSSDAAQAGHAVGVGCGLGLIFVVWAVVALPAAIVWVMSRRS